MGTQYAEQLCTLCKLPAVQIMQAAQARQAIEAVQAMLCKQGSGASNAVQSRLCKLRKPVNSQLTQSMFATYCSKCANKPAGKDRLTTVWCGSKPPPLQRMSPFKGRPPSHPPTAIICPRLNLTTRNAWMNTRLHSGSFAKAPLLATALSSKDAAGWTTERT